jgi:hypothetical protein
VLCLFIGLELDYAPGIWLLSMNSSGWTAMLPLLILEWLEIEELLDCATGAWLIWLFLIL